MKKWQGLKLTPAKQQMGVDLLFGEYISRIGKSINK